MNKNLTPAATVLVLKDSQEGIEVLMVKRSKKSSFGNLYVFPGGKIDEDDYHNEWELYCDGHNDNRASEILGLKDEEYVVNLQGDEPFTDPTDLNKIFSALENSECQTVSLFTDFKKESDLDDLSKVKVELNGSKAKFFYRAIKDGSVNPYLHLGVYGFRYEALRRFVALPKTENEVNLKLEQLRALDNNMQIHMVKSEAKIHLGIDTVKDLEQANKLIVNDIE